ncbi:MAG: aconitase X catalytic domain-containing protein [Candidatus Micrarchaeota archaeon]
MQLTKEQQKMLDNEMGEASAQAMQILVALGKIYGAKNMIPVTSVQVAGVSYKTIGDAGLEYLQDYASKNAKVRVPTFLNPAGMDREQWRKMKVPEQFAKKQIEILDAFKSMGISMSCTCTPYLVGIRPKLGEHIAWAESSAVAFANSVLGARTNREGGPSALAAAICGFTPNYGLHLDENRISDFAVKVEANPKTFADFGALGSFVGKKAKKHFLAFTGIEKISEDELKILGASMAASGAVPLYYVKNITPEFKLSENAEEITITDDDIKNEREILNSKEPPQLITMGCPHASIDEIKKVANLLKGKKLKCELWVCAARKTKQKAAELGYVKIIEDAGGIVVADTCMVVSPLTDMGFSCTGCNSGKAAKYLQSLGKQKVVFGDIDDIILLK